MTKKSRFETEQQINVRAWKDPAFRKKLHANPHEALKEFGMQNLPASLNIKVLDEDPNTWCIVVRSLPEKDRHLNDEELKQRYAAGGKPPCHVSCAFHA